MSQNKLQYSPANPQDIAHVLQLLEALHPIHPELKEEFYRHTVKVQLEEGEHLLYQG